MDKPTLSPDAQQRIQALCRQISVAHDLDPEIQKELFGHMEDKLLAYLAGEEAVSQEDAFILMREHFGNPAALKSMLRKVHACEARVNLFRRIAGAIFVFLIMSICLKSFRVIDTLVSGLWLSEFGPNVMAVWIIPGIISIVAAGVGVAGFWWTLRRWQRKLDHDHPVWCFTTQPRFLIYACLGLLIAYQLVPRIMFSEFGNLPVTTVTALYWSWTLRALSTTGTILIFVVFLWWCDQPPRTKGSMLLGVCALMLLFGLKEFPIFVTVLTFTRTVDNIDLSLFPVSLDLLQGKMPGLSCYWHFNAGSLFSRTLQAFIGDPKALLPYGEFFRCLFWNVMLLRYAKFIGCVVFAVIIHIGTKTFHNRRMFAEKQ